MTSRPPLGPRAAAFPPTSVPCRPKRPLSASRAPVSSVVSPRRRPASASRVRATYAPSSLTRRVDTESEDDDVDTIAIPVAGLPLADSSRPSENDDSTRPVSPSLPPDNDDGNDAPLDRGAFAQAEQFLVSWQREEPTFRSPLLFAEASFAQAQAISTRGWPHPNAFLTAVALGSLELFCESLGRASQFPANALDVLSAAVFTNHRELRALPRTTGVARFLDYMRHGQFCFEQLHTHEEQLQTWRRAALQAKDETQRLNDQLQKQHVARLFDRVQARVKAATASAGIDPTRAGRKERYPQLRQILYGGKRGARLDIEPDDYDFEPTTEEMLLIFNSLRPHEARRLLGAMHAKAAEVQLPRLGELYATAVDILDEKERRVFLSEYFQLVSSEELQDALRVRDETNQDKRWRTFLDEMREVLQIHEFPGSSSDLQASFHSDEARIGASVFDLVDLVQEIAAEVALSDEKKPLKLSKEVLNRLKPYQTAKKKMEKAKFLMSSLPETVESAPETRSCGCFCGNHRLVQIEDDIDATTPNNASEITQVTLHEDKNSAAKRKKSTRRPSSAKTGTKRKSSVYNVSARVSTRNSMANLRLFPLAEVCQIVSLVIQLHFSRESTDGPSTRRNSTRRESRLTAATSPPRISFKALAKDLLTRKYGIKSIAVIHMLQLEKSLVHYGATNNHARCELFAWFVGADKTRSHYKDMGFQFYLRVVKAIVAVLVKKTLDSVSYADLITTWTERIGDADSSSGAPPPKTLSSLQCVEVCSVAFPISMQDSAPFSLLVERMRLSVECVDVDLFLKRVMASWEVQFVKIHAQVEEVFVREGGSGTVDVDFALFCKCVASCGIEMTTGQLIESFDGLLAEDKENAAIDKAILFVVATKNQ